MSSSGNENVGIAFALVIGAGASTAIGSSVVFFPSLVKYASKKTLAGGLGLSAGVMTYVSFVEIFQKSVLGFTDAEIEEDMAYIYATLCFFAGIVLMVLLNFVVHSLLMGSHDHHHDHPTDLQLHENEAEDQEIAPPVCADDPVAQLEKVQQMGQELEEKDNQQQTKDTNNNSQQSTGLTEQSDEDGEQGQGKLSKHESDKLNKMSLNTAIAIALHNFPEGLATFVATLGDPAVGAVLAIAIAIHNVPEGLCVSLPVYYATGNRCKAFLWGSLSGIAEPIAALLGWAVLANSFSDELYGVLFGMVSGMMVIISVRELLPTAHRYDPEDTVVTFAFIGGMGIMAISLVLFLL